MLLFSACGGTPPPATLTPEPTWTPVPTPGPAVFPTFAPEAADGAPVASIEYDNTWRPLKPGLEYVLVRGRVGRRDELLVVVRADPAQMPIRVRYDKDRPRLVREWFDQEQADVVINANFFLEDKSTAGLLIANGAPFGTSYRGFGGMMSISGGQARVQWLRNTPYQPDTGIEQAVQGAPMLVLEGRVVPGINDNDERNRRSFAAIDRKGWVVIGVSQTASWSLTDLATFLASARLLDVRNAVNLDGGASSGLWLRGSIDPVLTNSIDTVPSVIVIGG
jgi:uncharacterized protein YigE (DUF2233 family)